MAKGPESKLKVVLPPSLKTLELSLAEAVLKGLQAIVPEQADPSQLPSAEDVCGMLEQPPESKMGDFALPCFRFAKALRLKPGAIAEKLGEQLGLSMPECLLKVEIVGAFLNFYVKSSALAHAVLPKVADDSFFTDLSKNAPEQSSNVMVEFSQPNTHKEFHVGHGRNICLGDSMVRLARYAGFKVIACNYPGDEGKHIAKVLWYIDKMKKVAPETKRGAWLGTMYSEADRHIKGLDEDDSAQCEKEVSAVLSAIESKKGPVFEQWKETRQWSLDAFYEIYDYMDVKFDQYFFESEVSEESQAIVEEYLAKGVFKEDQGAVGLDLKEHKLGFAIVRKSDGNTLYLTKDLVLARRKFDQFNIDHNIYVVADEQNLHFRQVFKILELMGFEKASQCFHLSYGMVMLPEGRMSSRQGNSVTFKELLEAIEVELGQILSKYEGEWSKEEVGSTVKKLCIGAIRYGMLSTDPVKTIVFDIKEWLSFEGNSGPYLMYSYARTQSIIRKGAEKGFAPCTESLGELVEQEAKDLLRALYNFNHIISLATASHKPSVLTHYLFDLCKAFNRFYAAVPVLKAEDKTKVNARLALVEGFNKILFRGLGLLGITPPDRM